MKAAAKLLLRNKPILPPDVSRYDFAMSAFFKKMRLDEDSWFGWRTIWKVRSGMAINKKEAAFFDRVSGGRPYRKGKMPKNVCGILGRKSAKSTMGVGLDTSYDSLRFDPTILSPGEEAAALIICPNFRTSLIDIKFIEGLLEAHKVLARHLIARKQTEQIAELVLSNGISIKLVPVNNVTGRGPSTKTLKLDEAAFFKHRGQFCDKKIFEDARPGMIRFGEDSDYGIWTSPGRKQGLVWDIYQRYFGVDNDEVLVLNAPSRLFNPTLSQKEIEKELEARGESYVRREFYGEFVDAIEAALSEQSIVACANLILQKSQDAERFGVMDPAGLSPQTVNGDEFTAGVAHVSEGATLPDECRAWSANPGATPRTTSPKIALAKSIEMYHQHGVRKVWVDHYKIEWVRGELEEAGFEVEMLPPGNTLYLILEPALNSGKIKVPKDPITIQQLKSLERSSGRSEKDRIDHPRDEHDDRAMMVAQMNYVGQRYYRVDQGYSLDDFETGEMSPELRDQTDLGFGEIPNATDIGRGM